jgi:branched-chain amino acid transport system permease protein
MMRLWRRLQTPLLLIGVLLLVQLGTQATGDVIVQRIGVILFIHAMLTVALHLFMGNSGVVSFAHIGFMGIGAYASIIFTLPDRMQRIVLPNLYPFLEPINLPFLPALIAAGLVAALAAAVFGYPLMRLSGSASVIATFALLVILHNLLLNWNPLTNGPRTVFGIEPLTDSWAALAWAVAVVILAYAFKESRWGLMLRASREDAKAAASIGIDMTRLRWAAFVVSAFFTGAAGGLYAHFITSFGADTFFLGLTFTILAMLIIGGAGSVSGAVLGVIAVSLLAELTRLLENQINIAGIVPGGIAGATELVVSVAMLLFLLRRPGGITGGRELRLPRLRRSSEKETA